MNYEIKRGDKFLCLETYVMDDDLIAYTKGQTYISEVDKCITDNDGDKCHEMINQMDFFEHFKPEL